MKRKLTITSVIVVLLAVLVVLGQITKVNAQKQLPPYLRQMVKQLEVNRAEEKQDYSTETAIHADRKERACRTTSLLMALCEHEVEGMCEQKKSAINWYSANFGDIVTGCGFDSFQ